MNRPNLPPLRLAVAQFDDPKVLESHRVHSNRDIPHRVRYSTRLHRDLSFYSLASSSTPQYNSSSGGLIPPHGDPLSSRQITNAGYSSMPSSSSHSKRRSCSDMDQTSGSQQYNRMGLKNIQGHGLEAQLDRRTPRGISSSSQPNPQFSRSYRATQSEHPWGHQDVPAKPMQAHLSECYIHSSGTPHIYFHSHLEVANNSPLVHSQPLSNFSHQTTNLGEHRYDWQGSESRATHGDPELFPRSRVQPTETASGTRYFCPIGGCVKSFTRNFNLTQHISAIHKDERKFKCTYCRATFYRRNDLTRHERAHTGVRPYRCECGQDFTRTDLLARHKHSANCTYQINA